MKRKQYDRLTLIGAAVRLATVQANDGVEQSRTLTSVNVGERR